MKNWKIENFNAFVLLRISSLRPNRRGSLHCSIINTFKQMAVTLLLSPRATKVDLFLSFLSRFLTNDECPTGTWVWSPLLHFQSPHKLHSVHVSCRFPPCKCACERERERVRASIYIKRKKTEKNKTSVDLKIHLTVVLLKLWFNGMFCRST